MGKILENAKVLDWMKSLSEVDSLKPTHKKAFQWMEKDVLIPFWMFSNITDRVLDVEDDEYFDQYNDEHHQSFEHESQLVRHLNKIMTAIIIFHFCFQKRFHQ